MRGVDADRKDADGRTVGAEADGAAQLRELLKFRRGVSRRLRRLTSRIENISEGVDVLAHAAREAARTAEKDEGAAARQAGRGWSTLALAGGIAIALLAEIFVDTNFDRTATWEVVTSAGFTAWPTMALGLLMSNGFAVVAVTLVVAWRVRLAENRVGDVDLGLFSCGLVIVLLVAWWPYAVLYAGVAVLIWTQARRWVDRTPPVWDRRRLRMVWHLSMWLAAGVVAMGFVEPLLDGRAWTPVQQCTVINGVHRDARVIRWKATAQGWLGTSSGATASRRPPGAHAPATSTSGSLNDGPQRPCR